MKVGIVILMAVSATALSRAGEAVSGVNGKVGGFAGDMSGETGYNLEGSVSFPVGDHFGVQFDGLYTDVSDSQFYGAGTHLFWRDPEIGLLGLTGGLFQESDLLDSWSAGAEAEYYWKRLTFQASGGAVNIDYAFGPVPFIETDETDYYGTAGIGVYVLEDLLLSASYTYSMGNGLGRGGIEYQSPFPGLSIFGDVAYGDYDYDHAMIGVRYYIGQKKTLMQRHREDDPQNLMHSMLYNVGMYGGEVIQKANDYIEEVWTPPTSPGGSAPPIYGGVISGGGTLVIGGGGSGISIGSGSSISSGNLGSISSGGAISIGSGGSGNSIAIGSGTISSGSAIIMQPITIR